MSARIVTVCADGVEHRYRVAREPPLWPIMWCDGTVSWAPAGWAVWRAEASPRTTYRVYRGTLGRCLRALAAHHRGRGAGHVEAFDDAGRRRAL